MEERSLPFHGQYWSTVRGSQSSWRLGGTLVVSRIVGFGEGVFANPIADRFHDALRGGASCHVFLDVGQMKTYDSKLRTHLTEVFLKEKRRIAGLVVLSNSSLTSMGVAVANLALGGIIERHLTLEPFEARLDAALREANVGGITAHGLLSLHPA